MEVKKKRFLSISAYTILIGIIIVLAISTYVVPGVQPATLSQILMAPYNGFKNALDVCLFVMVLGGFLGVVQKTGALHAGIQVLTKKLKGKELILIPVLMFLFSIGGTTFGMAEETIAFYSLITATMIAAGFDSMVGVSVILLGAGVGVLGSTVNPFAIGVAVDTLQKMGYIINNAIILILGCILWFTSLAIAVYFVMKYAKKVQVEKHSIFKVNQTNELKEEVVFTSKMKWILVIFALAFFIMVLSVLPWWNFDITFFEGWTAILTGNSFGNWWFGDLSTWFFIVSIGIGLLGKLKEKDLVEAFIEGAKDMVGVVLVIAVARGASVLMAETGLDVAILTNASNALKGLSTMVFTPFSYFLYVGLSFLIPSTSGLAAVSIPILGPLTINIGYSVECMIMIFSAACGLVNLITPTSGVVMGGLAIGKVDFGSWLKFAWKVCLWIGLANIIILTTAMILL